MEVLGCCVLFSRMGVRGCLSESLKATAETLGQDDRRPHTGRNFPDTAAGLNEQSSTTDRSPLRKLSPQSKSTIGIFDLQLQSRVL